MLRFSRKQKHVGAVLLAGVLVRVLMFDNVGIWGDFGFYSYNSRLILEGQRPFIDFLGRSPLFMFTLAAVRGALGYSAGLLRAFIIFWWVAAAVPVYLIADHIRGHREGMAALALYLFVPFGVAYGMWANTQSLALFLAVLAIFAIIRWDSLPGYAAGGVLLAGSFLSRRSVVVILGALVLYLAHQRVTAHHNTRQVLGRLSALSVSFVATLAAGYLILGGDLETAWLLAQTHAINLFISFGRGGYPMLGVEVPPVTNKIESGRIPIFNDICQMCGAWTARTFAKTLMVTTPVAGIIWVYLRDWTDHYFAERDIQYLFGILGTLALYAIARAALAGYLVRAAGLLSFGLFAVLIYRAESVDRETLYERETVLLLLVLLGMAAGYLYRNRLLHTYYFMDFWPFLSVVAGILYVAVVDHMDNPLRKALTVVLVVAVVTSALSAHPVTVLMLDNNEAGWFTIENMDNYADDLDSRTEPGDVVLTANPSYLSGSHARMYQDNARIHYVLATFGRYEWGPAADLYQSLVPDLQNGHVKFVVMSGLTDNIILHNESAADAFETHYCRVDDPDNLYAETNATLYRYGECGQDLRPDRETINATR